MADIQEVERWVQLTDNAVRVVLISPVNGQVRVGEATMAILRGEVSGLLEEKYGKDHPGVFRVFAEEDDAKLWSVTYPVITELLEGIGFTKLKG